MLTTPSVNNREDPSPDREPTAQPRWLQLGLQFCAVLAIIAIVVKFGLKRGSSSHEETRPTAPAGSALEAQAFSPAEQTRAALDRTCKRWAQAIAKGQRPDGSFAGEERAQPSGWDTAQQLFALAEAKKACNGATVATLSAGARALEAMRIPGGWVGPRSTPAVAESSVAAWALLAFDAMDDGAAARRAREDLLSARNDDGGFRPIAKEEDEPSALYPTMLAAFALGKSMEADSARDWIARAIKRSALGTRELGSTEQLAYVYGRGSHDPETTRFFATETIAHCRPDRAQPDGDMKCTREPSDTGRSPFRADAGVDEGLVTPWHPWATLAASTLAREASIDPEQKKTLKAISQWGTKELIASSDVLGAAPAYKLAEYLIALSALIDRP